MKRFVGVFLHLFVIPGMLLYADNHFSLHYSGTMTGGVPGDGFGWIVRNIGDVNNDGADDLAITTLYGVDNDGTINNRNLVNIYYSDADFDTIPDLSFHSPATDILGDCDLNGDGYTDLVLANFYQDAGIYYDAGEIRVHFGSATGLDTIPDLIINGEYYYHHFGWRFATGNINGDRFDDLVVTAPDDDGFGVGRAYVFLGGNPMDPEPDWYFQPDPNDTTTLGAAYGADVTCGDLNNDGLAEFIISAPWMSDGGHVFVYAGDTTLSTQPVEVFTYRKGDHLGSRVTYLPPQSPNVYGSLLIGGAYIDSLPQIAQAVYVHGASHFSDFTRYTINSPYHPTSPDDPGGQAFFWHRGFGDFNGDGVEDFYTLSHRAGFNHLFDPLGDIPDLHLYNGLSDFRQPDTSYFFHDTVSAEVFAPITAIDLNQDGVSELLFNRILNPSGDWRDVEYFVDVYSAQPFNITSIEPFGFSPLPQQFQLQQNYPNPFNPTTTLAYTLPGRGFVELKVYNLSGELVRTLISEEQSAGGYQLQFDGSTLASGEYLYRLQVDGQVIATRKMVLVK